MNSPDRKALRNFALTVGIATALVFGLLLPWLWGRKFPHWPWIVLTLAVVWGLIAPSSLGPLYRVWMALAEKLGWFNNRVILSVVYFLIVFPLGFGRRLFGWDAMKRKFEPQAPSYRINKAPISRERFERPF